MINNSKNKLISISVLMIILIMSVCSTGAFAEGLDNGVMPVYFDRRDGIIRDGAVGDRPGIIGDEDKYDRDRDARRDYDVMTSSLVGGNNNNINDNVMPGDNVNTLARNGNTNSSSDEEAASTVFWGVIISLIIAAAIILLIVLMTPKTTKKNTK